MTSGFEGTSHAVTSETPPRFGKSRTTVTLAAGTNFVVCRPSGDIPPRGLFGYFAFDTRQLNRSELRVGGEMSRLIAAEHSAPNRLRSLSVTGDPVSPELLIERDLVLNDGLTETICIHNLRPVPARTVLDLSFGTDFADVFEVKRGELPRRGFVGSGPTADGRLVLAYALRNSRREVTISADRPATMLRDALQLDVQVPPHGTWLVTVSVVPEHYEHGRRQQPLVVPDGAETWGRGLPVLRSSDGVLDLTWRRATADLGALRLWDPTDTRYPVLAAGVPWFMALFGRDSLIAGVESLAVDHRLLLGSLLALSRRQGRKFDGRTGEAPGKILHELRNGEAVRRPSGWGEIYYGSVDATPLFVIALERAWRWGAPSAVVRELLDSAESAVDWILGPGDLDGDGFVEYGGDQEMGLVNQGWRDSFDGIRHPDGSCPEGPIALVEVQGYCEAALRALASLREAFDTGDGAPLRARAVELAKAIDDAYWVPEAGTYAVALDGAKNAVASVTSNPGHLLWTHTLPLERAALLAARLVERDLFSGFGLRTLNTENPGFNPLSYHCGSVWPHDTAMVAAGLFSYELIEEGERLAAGLLRAAQAFGHRLPELFGGFADSEFEFPVPYPVASSPQAWAAAAPILVVRALLGLEPDVPGRVVHLQPRLPAGLDLEVHGIPIGPDSLSLRASGREVEIVHAPPGMDIDVC